MWRDTLDQRRSTIETFCNLRVPQVAELHIKPVGPDENGQWDPWDIIEVLGDIRRACEKGEIEISANSMMSSLEALLPGIDKDTYLPIYKSTLWKKIESTVKQFKKDGYEVGKPPQSPYDPTLVSCTIDTDGQEGVSEAQAKALDYIEDNDEALCKRILEALYAAYREAEQEGYFIDDFKAGASSSDDLRTLCKCHGIHITQEYHNGMAYAEYAFQLAWLGEDQWQNVVLHGDRLIHVGGSGEGWEDPEA